MLIFMSLFILCAVLGFSATSEKKVSLPLGGKRALHTRADAVYLAGCLLLLFLVCGLRDISVGADTDNYVVMFWHPEVLNETIDGNTKYELGYVLFVNFLRIFGEDGQFFILATAAFSLVGVYLFIRSNCKGSYAIALMVYLAFLYYIDFSAIRQAMALSIAINCVPFLRKRQWIPAVLIVVLGALFHTTALLLLVMVPFSFTAWNKKKVVIAMALAVVGTLLFEPLVGIVLKIFPIYERYWSSEMMQGAGGIGLFAILVIALSVFAALMLFLEKAKFEDDLQRSEFIIALIGSVFTVAVNLLGREYGIFSRMTRYFIPFVMILATDVYRCCIPDRNIDIHAIWGLIRRCGLEKYCSLEKYTDREKYPRLAKCRIGMKPLCYLGVAGLMGIYFYTIMNANVLHILPYSFFFE